MATNIDTGLTVADALNADHSPHIFTMSNGDLLAIYYDGTNLVWRSKSGGSWGAKTTITLDTGVTPPQVSYLTRNGDVIFANVSKDPIDATHNADWFELTYTTATHTLATTAKQVDAGDGNEKAAGIGYISGATANNQVQMLHGNAAGNFSTVQQINVNPTIVGTDVSPTMGDLRTSANSGVITDGATTTYLIYSYASSGSNRFKVERCLTTSATTTVESPPAPAAAPTGIAGVYDGTNYVFIINENNAKLRYLTRTGANTYGAWTDILSDASLTGQPAVCVKANGDLALFYRTNKNQANGEIWVVTRIGGTWGSPSLLAGGAATGWSNPSCAASDLNDAGVARVVYVTGTASTWTLVEDSFTWSAGGVAIVGEADGLGAATLTPTVSHLITAESDGVGAATLTLTVSHVLTGEADGVGGATLALTVTRAMAGTAAGAGTASLSLTVSHNLVGEADGVGTATLSLTVTRAIVGTASGVGTATLALAGSGVQIVAQSSGVGTASLSLTVAHLISGTASGAGTASFTLTVAHLVTAQADGTGVATLVLSITRLIAGQADGVGVATLVIASAIIPGDVALTDSAVAQASLADALLDRASLTDARVAVVALRDA